MDDEIKDALFNQKVEFLLEEIVKGLRDLRGIVLTLGIAQLAVIITLLSFLLA